MKKKFILNLISLSLTLLLLILTMFSWYVSNREVRATGISGSTVVRTPIVKSVTIYSFGKKTAQNLYPVKQYSEIDSLTMVYNPNYALDSSDFEYSMKLLEIEFVDSGVNLQRISLTTSINKFIGYGNTKNWVTKAEMEAGLSLSAVTKFIVLDPTDVGFNEGKTTASFTGIDDYNYTGYEFDASGDIDTTYKNILTEDKNGIHSIYILVDFDEDQIDRLFSDNLGNSDMEDILYDDEKNLTFKCDFKFLLIGEEVE